MSNVISNKSANAMIQARNKGTELSMKEEAYLEHWYWYNRPTQNAMVLVDDVFAYLPEDHSVELGLVSPTEDFDCFVCGTNGILYSGMYQGEVSLSGLRWCLLTVDPTSRKKIEKAWRKD